MLSGIPLIVLSALLVGCSLCLVSGEPCQDWRGAVIAEGSQYAPARSNPCLKCICTNGYPHQCAMTQCAPPSCPDYIEIEGECCKYRCPEERPVLSNISSPVPLAGVDQEAPSGAFLDIMDQCCDLGNQWYIQSRERCSQYPTTPIRGIPDSDQMTCSAMIEVCCLGKRQERECTKGKQSALIRSNCEGLFSQLGNEDARECCNCCKLGMLAKDIGLSCQLMNKYSTQCSGSFEECCGEGAGLSPSTPPPTTTTTTVVPLIPDSGEDDMDECAKFPGQLCAHICINTMSSYRCACHDGFELQPDARTCRQSIGGNRCAENNPCQHLCVDTGVAVHCKCFEGYIHQADGRSCRDIDECEVGTDTCTDEQRCVNTEGSYACEGPSGPATLPAESCQAGYAYNRGTRRCEDIDECIINRHTCSAGQMCINTEGTFICHDGDSGEVDPDFGVPVIPDHEIPDQEEGAASQDEGHTVYQCGTGFSYNRGSRQCEDIDECDQPENNCNGDNQLCRNTVGSHVCMCDAGYRYNPRSRECEDDDECHLGTHNCGMARVCRNVPGSFRCENKECPESHKLNYRTGVCEAVICPRGLKADRSGNCIDINECIERPNVCRPNQECRNSIGSYICHNLINCGPGFQLNDAGSRCEDVNECETGTHDCTGSKMECVNRPGTYLCQCPDGYQLDHSSRSCHDIDECTRFGGQVCAINSLCENTPGSFRCTCKDGFQSVQGGRQCVDIDECERTGMCAHTCRNTWGSFTCTCRDGYQLASDGRSCNDLDECAMWAGRGGQLCIGLCRNTQGSYSCYCPGGYQMMSDGRTCQDIDECALRTANCEGDNNLCINTRGGYECQMVTCPAGFVKAPTHGSRNTNVRCQRKTFVCPQGDTECLYAPLSFSTNFITFPSKIRVPADLFTMRGPMSPYRRMDFVLKVVSAADPKTGENRTDRGFFNLKKIRDNEAVVELLREIEGPQNIILQLDMNIYSKEFSGNTEEIFFGTAVAKIYIFVTGSDW